MSTVKRKRIKNAEIHQDLVIVFKEGFQRVIIKSDENGRFIGVYYVTPGGEYLKNITDVINWLESHSTDSTLKQINFSFISKKLTEEFNEEYIIDQNKLPAELLDYVLEKKRSIAPGIVLIGNENSNESIDTPENEVIKQLKLDENIPQTEIPDSKENGISLNDVTFIKTEHFDFPEIPINQQHIFEPSSNCHSQHLINCINVHYQNKIKNFQPNCDNSCAFDSFGSPRVAFECDFCLILWHIDCSGYRWLSIDTVRLLMCDNCATLRNLIDCTIPNIFCDVEKLFESETKSLSKKTNTEIRVPPKLEPVLRLLKLQWLVNKHTNVQSPATSNLKSALLFQKPKGRGRRKIVNNELGKWKHVYETMVGPSSIVSETHEHLLRIQFTLKSIDQLCKILGDLESQLLIEENPVQMNLSRLTMQQDTLLIPIESLQIPHLCKALFFSFERNQDRCMEYLNRCIELRNSMTSSFYGPTATAPVTVHSDIRTPAVTLARSIRGEPIMPVISVGSTRPIQITPISTTNRFKIVSSSRVFVPKSKCTSIFTPSSGGGTGLTPAVSTISPTIVKLRQRKQDLGVQKTQVRVGNYMRSRQWNLLNLPFQVLERILSSSVLSTSDKLNCRLTNRVLKCIIDGGQVWNKLVISPGCVTGLDNMMSFFRSRVVRKITLLIDFQESFGLDFLMSFISRLKMFPENMNIDRFTIQFAGIPQTNSPCTLSVQDVLSCCKSVTVLSISSENPLNLTVSKKKLSSTSLVKLKLRNIQNVSTIIQTNNDCLPNLRKLNCGDWSFAKTIEPFHLTQLTTLHMCFSKSVLLVGITALSSLINLEHLTMSRPVISDNLISLVAYLLKSRKLTRFILKILILEKLNHDLCFQLASCFEKTVLDVFWDMRFESVPEAIAWTLVSQLHGVLPRNVRLSSSRFDPIILSDTASSLQQPNVI